MLAWPYLALTHHSGTLILCLSAHGSVHRSSDGGSGPATRSSAMKRSYFIVVLDCVDGIAEYAG